MDNNIIMSLGFTVFGAVLGFALSLLVTSSSQTKRAINEKKLYLSYKLSLLAARMGLKKTISPLSFREWLTTLGVRDIFCESAFLFLDQPLGPDRITSVYEQSDKPDSEEYESGYDDKMIDTFANMIICEKKKQALVSGETFDNNASYALKRIDVSRPESAEGTRENIYTLITSPTDFAHFVFPNLVLEETVKLPNNHEYRTIRNLLGIENDRVNFDELESLGRRHVSCKIGTCCALITADGYLVLSIRSKRQLIAGRDKTTPADEVLVHMSAAEGMFRSRRRPCGSPSDVINGCPHPFATIQRSLLKEINVDVPVGSLQCLGLFLDRQRIQPFFVFFHKLEKMNITDIFTNYNAAQDSHENEGLIGLKWTAANAMRLFSDPLYDDAEVRAPDFWKLEYEKKYGQKHLKLASNHAQTGLAAALRHDFGYKSCQDQSIMLLASRKADAS